MRNLPSQDELQQACEDLCDIHAQDNGDKMTRGTDGCSRNIFVLTYG